MHVAPGGRGRGRSVRILHLQPVLAPTDEAAQCRGEALLVIARPPVLHAFLYLTGREEKRRTGPGDGSGGPRRVMVTATHGHRMSQLIAAMLVQRGEHRAV